MPTPRKQRISLAHVAMCVIKTNPFFANLSKFSARSKEFLDAVYNKGIEIGLVKDKPTYSYTSYELVMRAIKQNAKSETPLFIQSDSEQHRGKMILNYIIAPNADEIYNSYVAQQEKYKNTGRKPNIVIS